MNYIGIDIGGTKVKIGLVDSAGNILRKTDIPTEATRPAEQVILSIAKSVASLANESEYTAIGVGCPGAIDSHNGIVTYANNLYWSNVELAKKLTSSLGKPCFVANDANAAALGEVKFGAGKIFSDAILITLGTGVGVGFVVGGKLFEGYLSFGAEGGHTVIRTGGVQCTCGRKGCLEAYASANALIRESVNAMLIDKNSLMWAEVDGDLNKVDGKTVFSAAKKGDTSALEVVNAYLTALSEGIVNFVNVFRCQAVILGGGVCAQGDYLINPIQEFVDKYRYGGKNSPKTKVLVASLGNDAGILGAAALCIKNN